MTDRITKIIIRGDISDLQAKMVAAGKSVGALGDKITSGERSSQKFRQGLTSVGDAAGKMGLVAAAGVAGVVAAAANFDSAMSNVEAATHESADNMEALRQAAIRAGADTKFSASEAAAAVENLSKAGVSTADILGGGLDGALSLAAAGTIEVGDAAEYAARAMSQFGLQGDQVPHIADLLAAAAGKAVGEVGDFGQALNQTGLVAASMGLTIEDTVGSLAAFAQAGLQGSDAGTAFKSMIQRLQNPVGRGAKALKEFGIAAYDTAGNFVGITDVAGQLQEKLAGVDQATRDAAFAQIFGSDAVRAANVLYVEGAEGIQGWIDKVNDQGYAAETAAIKMDNLKGDLEQLKGSLETALIGGGEGSQGILRGITQGATSAVNALNEMPDALKNVGMGMGALTAITGGGLFFGAKFINTLAGARETLGNLGLTSDKTKAKLTGLGRGGFSVVADQARAAGQAFEEMSAKQVALRGGAAVIGTLALSLNDLDQSADNATRTIGGFANIAGGAFLGFAAGGPIGAAIGGGVAVITTLVGSLRDSDEASRAAAEGAAEYGTTLDDVTGSVTDLTRARVLDRLESEGVLESLDKLKISSADFVAAILGDKDAAAIVRDQLASLRGEYTGTAEAVDVLSGALNGSKDAQDRSIEGLFNQGTAAAEAREAHAGMIPILEQVAGAFSTESTAVKESVESGKRKAAANSDVAGSTDDMTDATKDGTDATDDNTDAIKDNIDAMKDRVKAAIGALDAESAYQEALDAGAEREKERAELQDRINDAVNDGVKDRADLQRQLGDADSPEERARIQDQITESLKRQKDTVSDLRKRLAEYNKTLDLGTAAGRANMDILKGVAQGFNDLSGAQKNAKGAYRDAREELIKQAMQYGATKREAKKYADELLELPTRVVTRITLEKQRAQAQLDAFKAAFDGLDGRTAKAFVELQQKHVDTRLGPLGFKSGGYTGDYGISDVAGVVHGREFVVNAQATALNRPLLEALNRQVPGYRDGGYVRQLQAQTSQTTNYYAGNGGGSLSLSEGDINRLTRAMSQARPLYGDVTVHGDGSFRREMANDQRLNAMGGADFRE